MFTFKRLNTFLQIIVFSLFLTITNQAAAGDVDAGFYPRLTKNLTSSSNGNLTFQPDGKIIIFGDYAVPPNGSYDGHFVNRLNTDGTTDNSFNCSVCSSFYTAGATVQPDGKIIIGGFSVGLNTSTSYLIRLNPDGSQDPTFVSPNVGAATQIIIVQPDGKILIKYRASVTGFSQESIKRLNSDGTFDTTFTTISFAGGRLSYQFVADMVLLPDGKILVGGNYTGIASTAFLNRFNSDGTPDSSFGIPNFADSNSTTTYVSGMALQADGNYLVGGKFTSVNGINKNGIVRLFGAGNVDTNFVAPVNSSDTAGKLKILPNGQFITTVADIITRETRFVRFNADGSVDNTFNPTPGTTTISNWSVDSSNRIVFFGTFGSFQKYARLNSDGSLDTTFNPVVTVSGTVNALARQSDGKILVGGDFFKVNESDFNKITRLNADGTIDSSFNSGTGFDVAPTLITIQSDGKILVGGDFTTYNGNSRAKILRLNSDGTIDTSFNPTVNSSTNSIVTLASGKILIGGNFTTVNGITQAGLARLNTDGSLDTAFNPLFGNPNIRAILVLGDGKIMVGGGFSGVNGFNRTNLVRLNADGSLDETFNAGSISAINQIIQKPDGKYLVLSNVILRRNNDGTADSSFQAAAVDGTIKVMLSQPDGTIIFGGLFSTTNITIRTNFARYKSNGELDTLFPSKGANAQVNSIIGQPDGKIILGGSFTAVEEVGRSGIARVTIPALTNRTRFDYDGDGRADVSVFRPSTNQWYEILSNSSAVGIQSFGISGDIVAPADFDGDGKTDLGIFRPATGDWWYLSSVTNTQVSVHFGQSGDIPRPSDFDGDGKADFILYRPSTTLWYRLGSTGAVSVSQFGSAGDKPLTGDFDGDGKSDLAIYRPSAGTWWYAASSAGGQFRATQWGIAEDIPVAADYDGDGKTDLAVYRPSNGGWYILNSGNGTYTILQFGSNGDKPTAADYDGDGKADIAQYRPSTGTWYLLRTTAGFAALQFGISEDVPTENAFVP